MGTTIKIMLNTDRSLSNGSFPLVIRILHNRRKKIIYTSHHLFLSDFDAKGQKVLSGMHSELTRKEADDINGEMAGKKRQIEQILAQFESSGKQSFSLDDLTARLTSSHSTENVLIYITREIALMRETGRFGSASLFATTHNSLKRFLKNRQLTFTKIDRKFILDYSGFLQTANLSRNTIHMYLRNLRTIYYKAQKEGLFAAAASPFEDVDIRVAKAARHALSKESIRRIANADFSYDNSLDLVRDIFMFSFYSTGMSLVDIIYLRCNDMMGDVLYYKSNKTNLPLQVHITAPLRKIMDKYRNKSPFVFPILQEGTSDSLYKQYRNALNVINYNLKRLGILLDLECKLTTQVARHSWEKIIKTEVISISAE